MKKGKAQGMNNILFWVSLAALAILLVIKFMGIVS